MNPNKTYKTSSSARYASDAPIVLAVLSIGSSQKRLVAQEHLQIIIISEENIYGIKEHVSQSLLLD